MLDFLMISTRARNGCIEVYPKFIIKKSSDLMVKGGDFYAIWNEQKGLWSTDEQDVVYLVDYELEKYNKEQYNGRAKVLYMWDAESGVIDTWHKYCQKQLRDYYKKLDRKVIFSNTTTNKEDYASKKLSYNLEKGSITSYDRLMSVLYSEEERRKLEWAIGSIVSGDSKDIQKFIVLYGEPGSGKSTVLNIINDLFKEYVAVFNAKNLGDGKHQFALEALKKEPLVAIQHDGDLSAIQDNTILNSIISHETLNINEKHKSLYENAFDVFMFLGTNKPVLITDSKSGLIRRLIDVYPTGNKIPVNEYRSLTKSVKFELGAIAEYCLQVYLKDPLYYEEYIPVKMMTATNDFYNFVLDSYNIFSEENSISLTSAWNMYKEYCDSAYVTHKYNKREFAEELKSYFKEYKERYTTLDGLRIRSYYIDFTTKKFENKKSNNSNNSNSVVDDWLNLEDHTKSELDLYLHDCKAQYATQSETPLYKWDNVTTTLKDINPNELHYVKPQENMIVIDFDIKTSDGLKDYNKNIESARKFPKTYAEVSKSGGGLHLHYLYTGDVSKLSRVYDDNIEIKIFTGNSSLRRKLSKCNNEKIAYISAGLPLKGDSKMIDANVATTEKGIRTSIKRNLNKEIHPATKPSIDFIYKILEEAYHSGVVYDVSDMENAVFTFALNSTNQSEYCVKLFQKMHFKSEKEPDNKQANYDQIVFYDVEVFPNLFLVCWKFEGPDKKVVRMFNPTPDQIEELVKYKLIGFNCRSYDNHILYARMMGYSNEQLYKQSQRIVNNKSKKDNDGMFLNAYNLSYTDVYDFSSVKQSLKKFEIELGIHHQELGLPWDKPVDESLWSKVAEYCDYDVLATEAVFNARQGDFLARQILADIAGGTVNNTTNSLTAKLIFGNEKNPKRDFVYRDLSKPVYDIPKDQYNFLKNNFPEMMAEPFGEAKSILPYFEGYKCVNRVSSYRDIDVIGEGGHVWAKPGMYGYSKTYDVTSMHPHSVMTEYLFGKFTQIFHDLVYARVYVKHKDFGKACQLFDGKLKKYLTDPDIAKGLAGALKIAINAVYGLTSATFDSIVKDPRNTDNIVAKRGALFMINLRHEIEARGGTVFHIKTDSIKIENPSEELEQFIYQYGKRYGYTFEIEHVFEKICLVNNAVYIGKLASDDPDDPGKWTATGTQFAVPYVFKTLFSKEPITFDDLCETKSVQTAIYLDRNEGFENYIPYQTEFDNRCTNETLRSTNATKGFKRLNPELAGYSDQELEDKIKSLHSYSFVGKVGRFCPIKPGYGGGILLRDNGKGGYSAVNGTDNYRWLETEEVVTMNKEEFVDKGYYNKLVDDAIKSIRSFGDDGWFIGN